MKKDNIKDDYILMTAAVLLLVISGAAIFWFSIKKESVVPVRQPKMEIIGSVVLTVDFRNGKKRSFEGDIIKGETPIDALIQASKAGNLYYKFDEKNGLAAIDNFVKNNEKSWHWYINDKKIDKPLNEIILKSGDRILIKYE